MEYSQTEIDQIVHEAQSVNPLVWIYANKVNSERGVPLSFRRHKYLLEPFNDLTKKQVFCKSAQVGVSIMMILKTFWLAKFKKYNIIYCVDTETEVLTEYGFKKYTQLQIGEKILTLGIDGITRWSPIQEVFSKNVETEMYKYKTRNFDAYCTSGHRWIVQDWKGKYRIETAKNFKQKELYIPKRAGNPKKKKYYTDEFVILLAWVFSEGYYCKQPKVKDYSIIIAQSREKNPLYCQEIRECLIKNKVTWKEYFNQANKCINFRFAFDLGEKIKRLFPQKIPTANFAKRLTQSQAQLFIETFAKGDGWINKSKTTSIIQKNKECIDILSMIAILAGYSPSLQKPGINKCWTLVLTQFPYVYTQELKPIISKEKLLVWCPRTEQGTFYARRNGRFYWTGNTVPTVEDVRKFVPSKVNPIIHNNPQIGRWVKDKDSIETKQVDSSFIFYKGTFTAKEAIMLTSDLNVYDEVDRSDLATIDVYSSRVKFSPYAGEWYLSNPSVPSAGVGAKYALSDQRMWFILPSCGHRQYMDWENNVNKGEGRYECFKCHKPISNTERINGEWVAKYPEKSMHGYWINQMMAEWIDCKSLILEEEDKDKAYFYNFVLGKPYMGSDTVIDASLILRNITEEENSQTKCIMGVDQGLKKHYVIGNSEGIFQVGSTKDWSDIENLRNKFDAVLIMDALPDLTVPRQLREKYPHRVHLCYYHKDKDKAVDTKWGEHKDWGYVWADRNRTLQTVIDYLAGGKIKFNLSPYDLEEYIKHWKTLYKIIEEDFLGVPKFVWESTGAEHFVHATNYWLLGLRRYGEKRGSVVTNPQSHYIHGEPSFEIINDTMPGKAIFEKPEKDWRYT